MPDTATAHGCDATSTLTASGVTMIVTNCYVYGLDLSGSLQGAGNVGGLLARVGEGGTLCCSFDGNGNVSDLVDASSAVRGNYEYAPFGGLTAMTGDLADTNPIRFSTQRQDVGTGFLYYGHRDLDTVWGRWLSRDPITGMLARTTEGGIPFVGMPSETGTYGPTRRRMALGMTSQFTQMSRSATSPYHLKPFL